MGVVNICVRNSFRQRVSIGTINYTLGYDHYRLRNQYVNKGLYNNKCPRYNKEETYQHIIQFQSTHTS